MSDVVTGRCTSRKRVYRSYAKAAEALLRVAEWRLQNGHADKAERQVYRCPTCHWWHLTAQIDYRTPVSKEAK